MAQRRLQVETRAIVVRIRRRCRWWYEGPRLIAQALACCFSRVLRGLRTIWCFVPYGEGAMSKGSSVAS